MVADFKKPTYWMDMANGELKVPIAEISQNIILKESCIAESELDEFLILEDVDGIRTPVTDGIFSLAPDKSILVDPKKGGTRHLFLRSSKKALTNKARVYYLIGQQIKYSQIYELQGNIEASGKAAYDHVSRVFLEYP